MNKPILAIDIDDVLAANAAGFVKFSNERWGTNLTLDDYDEHWANVWQLNEEETSKRAVELHESGEVGLYEHFPDAVDVLKLLHNQFKIIAVTSRRQMIEKETRAWIEQYFTGLIDDIRFAGFYDDLSKDVELKRSMTKTDILKSIDAEYFIDDQLKHCLSAADEGLKVVLFGDYKWNQSSNLPESITRCATWYDVARYFKLPTVV
jgi:5'(3')-deoxyribonucleotidase